MPSLEKTKVRCYFDPVTDICLMATTPDGEQHWLAGSSKGGVHPATGEYVIPMIVSGDSCEACEKVYQWQFCPLGKTADELKPYGDTPCCKT